MATIKCIPVSSQDLNSFAATEARTAKIHAQGVSRTLSAPCIDATAVVAQSAPYHQTMNKEYFLPKPASVIGHRGLGSNLGPKGVNTLEGYFAGSIRENTMLAFNTAAAHGADFVELDVQVTKDGVPVIWHDDFIHYKHFDSEEILSKTIRELTLAEFKQISYLSTVCPKKPIVLMRKFDKKSEEFRPWVCRQEDQLPTLEEVLRDLPLSVGINLELKFEDEYKKIEKQELTSRIMSMMSCIRLHSNPFRKIVLSSFSPDACIIVSGMNPVYPVMMLTDAGYYTFPDERRNSIGAAYELAKSNGMFGVVTYSHVLPSQEVLAQFEKEGLVFMSYGEKNNENSHSVKQIEMGIHAVIVDNVMEVHNSISKHILSTA